MKLNRLTSIFILNIFLPGLGYFYAEKKIRGYFVLLLYTFAIFLPVCSVIFFETALNKASLSIIASIAFIQITTFVESFSLLNIPAIPEIRRSFKSLLGIGVMIYGIIIIIILGLFSSNYSLITIDDMNNFPTLIKGDMVLIKKDRFIPTLTRGNLVATNSPIGKKTILRVIGMENESVIIMRGQLIINQIKLNQLIIGKVIIDRLSGFDQGESSNLFGFLEKISGIEYQVFIKKDVEEIKSDPIMAKKEQVILMADNRTTLDGFDSRRLGVFHLNDIIGKPFAIIPNPMLNSFSHFFNRFGLPIN